MVRVASLLNSGANIETTDGEVCYSLRMHVISPVLGEYSVILQ